MNAYRVNEQEWQSSTKIITKAAEQDLSDKLDGLARNW